MATLHVVQGPGDAQLDEPFDDPEEVTQLVVPKTSKVAIPFGSTLSPSPLRVRLERGVIKMMDATGREVLFAELPGWERLELLNAVEFAQELGRL